AGPVRLDSLWLRLAPTGQVLVVEGLVDGGVVPVAPDVHLTIQLATDGGDAENVTADHRLCLRSDGQQAVCHELIFTMADGHTAEEIAPQIDSLGMRLFVIYTALHGGTVEVLQGTDDAAFGELQSLPNVSDVEYNDIAAIGVVPPPPPLPEVHGAVAVNQASVAAGNSALELRPGETITARYRQPDGTVLATHLHT
ncbi:MAG TPA: hypothetical protein VFW98_05220, partial [Gemmatimonadaceae bacterium]|nr:hypothetical protein [Gemmatimonadaceae bacterium]